MLHYFLWNIFGEISLGKEHTDRVSREGELYYIRNVRLWDDDVNEFQPFRDELFSISVIHTCQT